MLPQYHQFDHLDHCVHCHNQRDRLVSSTCAVRMLSVMREEENKIQSGKVELTLLQALDWCKENEAIIRFTEIPSNKVQCVTVSVGDIGLDRRVAVGDWIEDAVAKLIGALEVTKDQGPITEPAPADKEKNDDLEAIDRVVLMSSRHLDSELFQYLEMTLRLLKQRASEYRRPRKYRTRDKGERQDPEAENGRGTEGGGSGGVETV